uniref:Uncharacterized protein n=1 Tax=Periophthalmus magnuspinnatus TaxID=409849 RepID=A0A3B4A9F5_9GOBI
MESQCEYLMYFPAVPLSELSDPARYRSLPRRSHLYLGETVRFLLVLRCRDSRKYGLSESTESGSWRDLASSLCAVASVSPGDSSRHRNNQHHHGDEQDDYMAAAEAAIASPLDEPVVLSDEVIFPLTVSLDKLPVTTLKVKVMVTVWKREQDKAEVQELGYLSVLQQRAPVHTFRHDLNTFKAQVSTTLSVLPPPTVRCKQMTVSGRHLAVLKGTFLESLDFLNNYLWCCFSHQSGEVGMGSFSRVDTPSGRLPSMLSALEEHDFLFQLHLNDTNQEESTEGLEVPLVAVIQWSTPKMPFTNCIYTHYRLPSIRLDQPRFVMTASCPRTVRVKEHFRVRYVLLNNLQDFLAVRLVWTPEGKARGSDDPSLSSVVCLSPLSNLGHCRKGSTLSFSVGFQILRPGLYELSQHMKLKLQFTASVSNPPPDARPLSRKNSPSSPAVRDLLDRHQASLGRSQSFSHQQPSRSHIMRTGSAMERRAITPPVGSPVGRSLYLPPPERTVLSLDKIAKRECKVLVLDAAA